MCNHDLNFSLKYITCIFQILWMHEHRALFMYISNLYLSLTSFLLIKSLNQHKTAFHISLYTFKFTGLEINKDSVSLKLFGWSLGTFSIISDLQQNIKTKIKTTTKKKYKPKHSQFYTDRIRGASANLIKKFWKQTIQPRFSDS